MSTEVFPRKIYQTQTKTFGLTIHHLQIFHHLCHQHHFQYLDLRIHRDHYHNHRCLFSVADYDLSRYIKMFRTFYQHFYSSLIPPWNRVVGYNIWYTWAYRTGAGCNGCGSIWRCCWIIIFFAVPWANLPCVWIHCITPFQASLSWSQPSYGMYQEKRALKCDVCLQKNNITEF